MMRLLPSFRVLEFQLLLSGKDIWGQLLAQLHLLILLLKGEFLHGSRNFIYFLIYLLPILMLHMHGLLGVEFSDEMYS